MSLGQLIVWSKPDCPFCSRTKSILRAHNISFEEKMLDRDFTRNQILEMYPSAKSFPIVVIDGFYIGGYNQLVEKLEEQNKDTRLVLVE